MNRYRISRRFLVRSAPRYLTQLPVSFADGDETAIRFLLDVMLLEAIRDQASTFRFLHPRHTDTAN